MFEDEENKEKVKESYKELYGVCSCLLSMHCVFHSGEFLVAYE